MSMITNLAANTLPTPAESLFPTAKTAISYTLSWYWRLRTTAVINAANPGKWPNFASNLKNLFFIRDDLVQLATQV